MQKLFRLTAKQCKIELMKARKLKQGLSLNFAPPSACMANNDYAKKLLHGCLVARRIRECWQANVGKRIYRLNLSRMALAAVLVGNGG